MAVDESLTQKYGAGAPELFARLAQLSDVGGHAGVTRYLYDVYMRRPDLREAYPGADAAGAWALLDWAYRFGLDEVPIPPELLATDWLAAPAERGGEVGVNRYLERLYERSDELRREFPDIAGDDAKRYVEWARTVGIQHDPILRVVLEGPPDRPAWRAREGPRRAGVPRGVNVVGFLRGELGLGEAARLVVTALDAARVPLLPVAERLGSSRQAHSFDTVELDAAAFETNLVCLNPDQHWTLARDAGDAFAADRPTIGFWWWEIADVLPVEWRPGFRLVDEVWVGSDHAATAIRPVAPVPVTKVRIPVVPRPIARADRVALGLPDGFMFLVVFDYNSTVQRKNPLGAIAAFRSAFGPGSGPVLVLKSVNGDRHPAKRAEIEAAAAGRSDIHLVDGYVSVAEKNAILAACDCYVSLHRAEGFGLPLAEAMYFGRPAIATRYSGNLEFMTDANSYLVAHGMTAVGADAEPYYPAAGRWAEPSIEHAAALMRAVVEDPGEASRRGQRAADDIRREFSPAVAGARMSKALERFSADGPPRRPRANGLADAQSALRAAVAVDPRLGGGRVAVAARRALLRVIRPYVYHQQRLNEALGAAVDRLEAELTKLEARDALGRAGLLGALRERDMRMGDPAGRHGEADDGARTHDLLHGKQ